MTLRDILQRLGIEFAEHGESGQVSAGWVGIRCPHCAGNTGKFKCGINLRHLSVSCYTCGRHKLSDTLSRASGVSLRDVLPLLVGLIRSDDEWEPRTQRLTGTLKFPDGTGELLPVHRKYLEKRGFDPDECERLWGLKGIGAGGRYQWRILLPVLRNAKPVSWQTRAIGQHTEPRYLAASPEDESVPLKHCLGGSQHARQSVVVCEGYFQAMRIGPGAVATMGVGYTEHQLLLIAQYPSRCICFDNEPQAQRRAHQLATDLSPFPGETLIANLSGPQPDSSPADEIRELRARCLS